MRTLILMSLLMLACGPMDETDPAMWEVEVVHKNAEVLTDPPPNFPAGVIIGGDSITCAWLGEVEPEVIRIYRMHYRIGDGPERYRGAESHQPISRPCASHSDVWVLSGTRYNLGHDVSREGELRGLCANPEPVTVTYDMTGTDYEEPPWATFQVVHDVAEVEGWCAQLGLS